MCLFAVTGGMIVNAMVWPAAAWLVGRLRRGRVERKTSRELQMEDLVVEVLKPSWPARSLFGEASGLQRLDGVGVGSRGAWCTTHVCYYRFTTASLSHSPSPLGGLFERQRGRRGLRGKKWERGQSERWLGSLPLRDVFPQDLGSQDCQHIV